MRKSRFLLFIILAAILAGLFYYMDKRPGKSAAQPVSEFAAIDEAYSIILKKAVYPVSGDRLVEGAVKGMATVIGDPYSTYLSEEEAAAHEESLSDERVGIGAEISQSHGRFIIVAPVKSSPAEKAGIQPFDEIVRVDGTRLEGKSMKDLLQMIRGKKGTEVSLTIYRPDADKHMEIKMTRAAIPVKTVTSEVIKEEGKSIGYVTISMFGEEAAMEWEKHTRSLIAEGIDGLLIDVRGNPGGYLHSVEKVAGSMLPAGAAFTYMQNADGVKKALKVQKAEEDEYSKRMQKIPVVLMQDEGSASASEVLSASLKDLKRAFITGTTSFGKGTVQETIDLSNGGKVKLSTNKWLTPNQQWIHGKGVKADLEVEQNPLFKLPIVPVAGKYKSGDFNEEIAYVQKVLSEIGYDITRNDGYYDETTAKAVTLFRKEEKLPEDAEMDDAFFRKLQERVMAHKNSKEHDKQYQVTVSYFTHVLKSI